MHITPPIVWLALVIVFAVVEAATMNLTAIWFAAGAAVAMLTAVLDLSVGVQIIAFLVVSGVVLFLTRPLAKKFIGGKTQKTNLDRVVGMECLVTEKIENAVGSGQIKLNGSTWTARTADGTTVAVGARVRVIEISGVKAIVENIN